MKLTLNHLMSKIKTKYEASSVIKGLWIARSAIGLYLNNNVQPVFGFGADFNLTRCKESSKYELLEHLIFTPAAHDQKSIMKRVIISSNNTKGPGDNTQCVGDFLIGSPGPNGIFYGNGCGIYNNIKSAIKHAQRELLERHICCEIWYNHSRPLIWKQSFSNELLPSTIKIELFTSKTDNKDIFAIASLDCNETGFFALGAAIRSTAAKAYQHAISEVAMIYEDVKKGRAAISSTKQSKLKILSLRNSDISIKRKKYFYNLVNKTPLNEKISPIIQVIAFKPLPTIYAARAFSNNILDPRQLENQPLLPNLPLF